MAGESGLYSADLGGDCKCFLHSNLRGNTVGGERKSNSVLKVTVHYTNFSNNAAIPSTYSSMARLTTRTYTS